MPFIYPHRNQIVILCEKVFPSIKANSIADTQLLTFRKQFLEAFKIYPFKTNFKENFKTVFGHDAPEDEKFFWELFYAMKDDYTLETYLELVVPYAVADISLFIKHIKNSKIKEQDAIQAIIELIEKEQKNKGVKTNQTTPISPILGIECSQAVFNLPMQTNISISKKKGIIISDLRKLFPDTPKFVQFAYQYYKTPQSKRSLNDPLKALDNIDPLEFAIKVLTKKRNDIAVECSLFIKKIVATINHRNAKNEKVIVVLPSFEFIYQWCNHPLLSSIHVTFIVQDSDVCKLLALSKYAQKRGGRRNEKLISFHDFEDTQRKWRSNKIRSMANVFAIALPEEEISRLSIVEALQPFITNKLLAPNCRIVGFYGRTHKTPKLISDTKQKAIIEDVSLQAVAYLPRKIALSTAPRTKVIFEAIYQPDYHLYISNIDVKSYQRIIHGNKAYLRLQPQKTFSVPINFDLLHYTHQQLFTMERILSREIVKRGFPQLYSKFGPNIPLWYTTQTLKNGKIRYTIHLSYPVDKDKFVEGEPSKGFYIETTKRQLTKDNPDTTKTEFFNQYLFCTKRIGDKKTTIRSLVAAHWEEFKISETITLREFWFLHPAVDVQKDKDLAQAVQDFMLSRHADKPIKLLDADKMEAAVEEHFYKRSLDFRIAITDYIADIFALAAKEKYIAEDIFLTTDTTGKKHPRNVFKEIRDVLKNRYLTIAQMRALQAELELHQSNMLYVGANIQLNTGIEIRELCSLRWRAFQYNDTLQQHTLRIDEQLNMDGESTNMIRIARINTLPKKLEEFLATRYEHLLRTFPKPELDEMFIVTNAPDHSGTNPRKYRDFVHKLVRPFFPVELQVLVPHIANKSKNIDLSGEDIDFLRHNYEYHGRRAMKLTNGESSYSLGINPKYTMDNNYIDHEHVLSQKIVQVKVSRLTASVEEDKNKAVPERQSFRGNSIVLSPQTNIVHAQQNTIQVYIPAGTTLHATFENQHGMNINTALYPLAIYSPNKKEENENDYDK